MAFLGLQHFNPILLQLGLQQSAQVLTTFLYVAKIKSTLVGCINVVAPEFLISAGRIAAVVHGSRLTSIRKLVFDGSLGP